MPAISQPAGSVKLTNVCVVRLRRGGAKLEVAAYANSVGAWRAGLERDPDAVLQTRAVFTCAARGTLAPRADIEAALGAGVAAEDAAVQVLNLGVVQEGEVERGARLVRAARARGAGVVTAVGVAAGGEGRRRRRADDPLALSLSLARAQAALYRDVAATAAGLCADPRTARPVSAALVERALRAAGFSLAPSRSAKENALRAVAALSARPDLLPLARARMRLRVTVPPAGA